MCCSVLPPRIPRDLQVSGARGGKVLRGPVARLGKRKGCVGAGSVADVSACLREALKLKTVFRLKLFSAGAGTESQLDGFQSRA